MAWGNGAGPPQVCLHFKELSHVVYVSHLVHGEKVCQSTQPKLCVNEGYLSTIYSHGAGKGIW